MHRRTSAALGSLLDELRPELLLQLSRYLARAPRAAGGSPEQVLEEHLGGLWLELSASEHPDQDWPAALRRVLYREREQPLRRRTLDLTGDVADRRPRRPCQLAPQLQPWLDRLLGAAGRGARLSRLARELSLSRAIVRMRLTATALALTQGRFFDDLLRRTARLHARAARDGPGPAVRREARRLLRLMALLELPGDLRQARAGLKKLLTAGRRLPGAPGNQECASACTAPRATAEGR